MEAVRETVRRLPGRQHAGRRLPAILLQGETGTGKGLVARLIHRLGPRAGGPFVDVNCAAIPETLLEAELFGFERGAFTDARQAKPGLFQTAHRGTIFLDEIGLAARGAPGQAAEGHRGARRCDGSAAPAPSRSTSGSSAPRTRISRRSVRERRFREDLYHRLAVLTLRLPPLRERGQRRPAPRRALPRPRLRRLRPAGEDAGRRRARRLLAYPWPGNVRELSNVIERVALLTEENVITGEHLGLGGGARRRDPRRRPGQRPGPADLVRGRHARAPARHPRSDRLEHLAHGRPPRHLAQHGARAHREAGAAGRPRRREARRALAERRRPDAGAGTERDPGRRRRRARRSPRSAGSGAASP